MLSFSTSSCILETMLPLISSFCKALTIWGKTDRFPLVFLVKEETGMNCLSPSLTQTLLSSGILDMMMVMMISVNLDFIVFLFFFANGLVSR